MIVWIDGALVEAEAAFLPLDDRGFTLADSLFETLRVRRGEPGLWKLHMARLSSGLDLLGLPQAFSANMLAGAVQATLQANRLSDAAVRMTITAGSGPRGLRRPHPPAPRILVTVTPLGPNPPDGPIIIAQSTRRNEFSPLARVKTAAHYPDHLLALSEAQASGATDALLLNTNGALACATTANLIVCRGGEAWTPRIEDGALPGTVRHALIERGLVCPRRLLPNDLIPTDGLLLVNALGVRRVWLSGEAPPEPAPPATAELLDFLQTQILI
jgi:branched-chain amino acid aminotransferase